MPDDVDVAVVGTELEEDLFWTVPLIDDFLDEIFAMTQLKAHRPFVTLPARVGMHAQLHLIIVAQNRFEMASTRASSHLSCRTGEPKRGGQPATTVAIKSLSRS